MIVVVGESLVDVVVDLEGEDPEVIPDVIPEVGADPIPVERVAIEHVGGSPLNVAVGLARLDVPALLITQLGHDARGGVVAEHVRASGAELETAPTSTGRTPVSRAFTTRSFVRYEFDLEWTLPAQVLPACDVLHLGSLGTVLEPGRTSVADLADQAYARDVFVSYDPNVRPQFIDDRTAAWRDLEALAERANLVKLSTEDVDLLQPGADPADIARSLLGGDRTELVVVTDGPRGSSAYAGGLVVHEPAAPVRVIDGVGAGDSFTSALLAILWESDAVSTYGSGVPADEASLRRLLRGAAHVAAITCGRAGANPPYRAELDPDWPG